MNIAEMCFSKACVNFGRCHGNRGWGGGRKIIFVLKISSFKLSESFKSVAQGVPEIFEEMYLGAQFFFARFCDFFHLGSSERSRKRVVCAALCAS